MREKFEYIHFLLELLVGESMDILIDKNQVPPLLQKPNSVVPLDFKMFKFCFGRLPYLVHVSRMGWLLTKRVRI